MRLALVSPFDPFPASGSGAAAHVGGVERVYAEVSRRLAARGHDAVLLCSTDGPSEETVEDGVHVVREHRPMTVMRTPVCRLARRVPADADVVQVAATYPLTTPPVLRRAHQERIPTLLDFHFEPSPPGALGRAAAGAYRHWGPRAYGLASAVVARSRSYAEHAPSLAHVAPGRLRFVPNGIDPARFHARGERKDGDYLLFVGRLVPYKGVDVLLHAMARSRVALPLVLVGEGPERGRLEKLAARLGVDAHFVGHVGDDELAAYYRGARLTVLPSVNGQEAFGITLLESMACGTPVVASDLPGVDEVARVGGLVASPGDPEALAFQIQRALSSEGLPRGGVLARRVHRAFSWDAVTDRLEALYEEVLDGPRAAA